MARIGIKQATKDKVIELVIPGVCDLSYPSSLTRRGRVQEGGRLAPTITTTGDICKIIRINPRE